MKRTRERGDGLIGLLLVTLIVLLAAWMYIKKPLPNNDKAISDALGGDTTIQVSGPEEAKKRAREAVEKSRQKRIELATDQFRAMEGREPNSLQELVDKNLLIPSDLKPKN